MVGEAMKTTEQLNELLSVAKKRVTTEQRNVPKTTMEYTEYLNAADAFREAFTPATCAELVRELIDASAKILQLHNEIDALKGYM